jgi:hypothetical protein
VMRDAIACRSASAKGRPMLPNRPVVTFAETSGRLDVMVGAVCVGIITLNPAGREGSAFFWRCTLPGSHATPTPVIDLATAKRTLRHCVADWFDATGDTIRARILREHRT